MQHSARNTVIFTTLLCVAFSGLVSSVSTGLRERQQENRRLDKIKNVLSVAGLIEPGETLSREEVSRRFEENLVPKIVDLETGQYVDHSEPLAYDQRKAAKDPDRSRAAPTNPAKVRRVPNEALVFLVMKQGELAGVIVPVEGYGLWSTLYGYLALAPDARTIMGLTYYQHGETAGLGGEVDNPRWKALWPGRKAFDDYGDVAIRVVKGSAGPAEEDPYEVDGLSGATITSNGVTNMLRFWLGEKGFGNYLSQIRQQQEMG
ncbi:MAG: Na(+)-translocating NADH-quinone reductase subunit C [Myxococcota bacterium]|nr:Na(+)-translocating NADH-quinone reductase subunit C [Myxococcota bacterium]